MADRRHRSMSWRQRKLVFGLLCLVRHTGITSVRAGHAAVPARLLHCWEQQTLGAAACSARHLHMMEHQRQEPVACLLCACTSCDCPRFIASSENAVHHELDPSSLIGSQVMAQSPARVRASPELAALIARDSISDIAGDLGMGALSGSAASPAGSGGDATAAYMASMGAAGGSSASQTSAGQPAAAPTGGRPTAVVKTDQQAALQSTAKQHALSEDKQRASADVAARPLSATAPKPPILLIHGGAQVGPLP